jgi:hypothetical protein
VFGQINPPWKRPRLLGFRSAGFHISPQQNGSYTIQYAWSNRLFATERQDMHYHTTKEASLAGLTLIIFLPAQNGDDSDPYGPPET